MCFHPHRVSLKMHNFFDINLFWTEANRPHPHSMEVNIRKTVIKWPTSPVFHFDRNINSIIFDPSGIFSLIWIIDLKDRSNARDFKDETVDYELCEKDRNDACQPRKFLLHSLTHLTYILSSIHWEINSMLTCTNNTSQKTHEHCCTTVCRFYTFT